jgi:hypothetical protein
MDAVSDVVFGIIESLEEDLASAKDDGYLERPTLAYVVMLHGLLKRIDGARDMVSAGQVSGWRDEYMDWLKSSASELEDEYAKDLRKGAKKEFDKLKALAEAPDEAAEEESEASTPQDTKEEHAGASEPIEDRINFYKENIAGSQKVLDICAHNTNCNRQYRSIWTSYVYWGELLWRAGQSPVELFQKALEVVEEWFGYAAKGKYALDYRRGGMARAGMVELFLGGEQIYQRVSELGDWGPLGFEKFETGLISLLDWTILECLHGEDRLGHLRELTKIWKNKDTRLMFQNYHDLIEAGIQKDQSRAEELIERQAQFSDDYERDAVIQSGLDLPYLIELEDGTVVPLNLDYRLAAIVKGLDINYPKPCAHLWRWD